MSSQIFRVLLIAFLVFRGVQHLQKPESWSTNFNQKYGEFYNTTANAAQIKEKIPSAILGLFHPTSVTNLASEFSQYIGYTELFTAGCLLFHISLLPIIGAIILLVETLVFYNPLNPAFENEIMSFYVNLAIVGLAVILALTPLCTGGARIPLNPKNPMTREAANRISSRGHDSGFARRAQRAARG